MGHDFHITKAADWVEAEQQPIDRQKWLSLAVGSPALMQAGNISFTDGPSDERVEYPVFGLLHTYGPSLYWRKGEVVVIGATDENISDLLHLARQLQARLLGDDGEEYE